MTTSFCLTILTYFKQSLLQQQAHWSQLAVAVPKQGKLPSVRWIDLISSFLEYFQVSFMPTLLAFFSISEIRILSPPL